MKFARERIFVCIRPKPWRVARFFQRQLSIFQKLIFSSLRGYVNFPLQHRAFTKTVTKDLNKQIRDEEEYVECKYQIVENNQYEKL